MRVNDIERLNGFDQGLAFFYALGYHQGYEFGSEITPGPKMTEAESTAYKMGYDRGVAEYSAEFDSERLTA